MSTTTRERIQRLDVSVINKIAAGEVIERPASVVKELVENALDARAGRIDVSVAEGGATCIRVTDNGTGIAFDELKLAVSCHATSKLRQAEELFAVHSLGFRGEALASIGEVSRLNLQSRTTSSDAGGQLVLEGGRIGEAAPCGCPTGTTVEVRDLFFNTPVRRKFLRTQRTELGHCIEAMARLALFHHDVHFTFGHGTKRLHDLPPASFRDRIASVLGEELAGDLLEIDSEFDGVRLSGYVANPTHSRSNQRMQYLALNGRYVRDRGLQRALSEAYRGLLLTGRYPICFLQIRMPPEMVDVNVHPTKCEVRFLDGSGLFRQLLGALRGKFLETDLTATATLPGHEDASASAATSVSPRDGWRPDQRQVSQTAAFAPYPDRAGVPQVHAPRVAPRAESSAPDDPRGAPASRPPAMQVHQRYLVAESPEGIVVIDQHALHERVLYEQLKKKVLAGGLERQKMLVPEPVDLTPSEAAAVLDQKDLLATLGIEIEPFGGDTVLVASFPAMLQRTPPAAMLRDVVESLLAEGKQPDRQELLDSLLHMMSCKAAVKAGDPLSPAEVHDLIDQRELADDAHHCPHGRPTSLMLTRDDLDRQFKRI